MVAFRGDIEGLRAVAVFLVLLDHVGVPGFQGGFVGVDVFFVISGFLITSLLAAEYAKRTDARGADGWISLTRFYLRRARRIVPAALTVILAVSCASRLLLNPLRAQQVQVDAVWALFFGANIHLIQQSSDYFAQGLPPSPLRHYWTLAVEEQFYVVWPTLFLLVARAHVLRMFGTALRWRIRLVVTIAAVGIASLVWSMLRTADDPSSAYFSTFARAWELALGALIGVAVTRGTQLPPRVAAPASVAGAVLLVLACALFDADTPFPGGAALLPTLATALLIMGGVTAKPSLPTRALRLAPLRFFGRVSYSMYLWHWPLIVFVAALYPTESSEVSTRLFIVAVTLGVSLLSFHLVEQPARRLSFTARRAGDAKSRPRRAMTGPTKPVARVVFGAGVLVASFIGAVSVVPRSNSGSALAAAVPTLQSTTTSPTETRVSGSAWEARGSVPHDSTYAEIVRAWQRRVRAGLSIRRLPNSLRPLHPHLVRYVEPYCGRKVAGIVAGECVVGNLRARHVAALTGDSHAGMFQVALFRALRLKSWRLHIFQRGHCGWAGSVGPRLPVSASECSAYQDEARSRIRALRPDLLVLSEADVVTPYRTALDISSALAAFSMLAKRVVVLGHTPTLPSFDYCLSGSADISRCVGTLSRSYRSQARRERILSRRAGVNFVDTSAWFCVRVGALPACPPVIADAPVWRDGSHVTSDLEPRLIPLIRAALNAS